MEWTSEECNIWTGNKSVVATVIEQADAKEFENIHQQMRIELMPQQGIKVHVVHAHGHQHRQLLLPPDNLLQFGIYHVPPLTYKVMIHVEASCDLQTCLFFSKLSDPNSITSSSWSSASQSFLAALHQVFPDVPITSAARAWLQENTFSSSSSSLLRKRPRSSLPPTAFYGSTTNHHRNSTWQSFYDRFQFSIRQSLECQLEGSAPISSIFPRQAEAFEFVDQLLAMKSKFHPVGEFPRVFSFENAKDGKRRFLVTTLSTFWQQYMTTNATERHVYEIIRAHVPCRLYFDLEFLTKWNSTVDGDALVTRLLVLLQLHLHRKYGLMVDPKRHVVQLDSSTTSKFSRHLIVHLPQNALFKNNFHVGSFVRSFVDDLVLNHQDGTSMFLVHTSADGSTPQQLLIDLGVYTRNRMFRVLGSSKYRKQVSLTLVPDAPMDKQLFERSLVCPYASIEEFNALSEDQRPRLLTAEAREFSSNRLPVMHADGSYAHASSIVREQSASIFPSLDQFIRSYATHGGVQGEIRTVQMLYPSTDQHDQADQPDGTPCKLVYHMVHNRFCHHIGRFHKSNNIMLIVDLEQRILYQKCHDPVCRSIDYRSPSIPVPPHLELA